MLLVAETLLNMKIFLFDGEKKVYWVDRYIRNAPSWYLNMSHSVPPDHFGHSVCQSIGVSLAPIALAPIAFIPCFSDVFVASNDPSKLA